MSISFYLILFLLLKSTNCQSDSAEEIIGKINVEVEQNFIMHTLVPGLSLSVVHEDHVLINRGYGAAKIHQNGGILVTERTLFPIASLSKSFTSTLAVKILHEKFPEFGEFVLEKPIQKLLNNDFILSDRFRSETASFRDLLAHRTCLQDLYFAIIADFFNNEEDYIYRARFLKEVCPFRSRFVYNNAMYDLAGAKLEEIANKSYTNMIQELFKDIGMNSSTFIKEEEDYENNSFAQGYYTDDRAKYILYDPNLIKRLRIGLASGGIVSCANDMKEYIKFHLNLGQVNNKTIVPKEAMKWLRNPSINLLNNLQDSKLHIYYGLGFSAGLSDGQLIIFHEGYFPPYKSRLTFFPEHNIGIFSSSNGPGVKADHKTLHLRIFDIITGQKYASSSSRKEYSTNIPSFKIPATGKDETHKFVFEKLNVKLLTGVYRHLTEGDIEINVDSKPVIQKIDIKYGKYVSGELIKITNSSTNTFRFDFGENSTLFGDFRSSSYGNLKISPTFNISFPNSKLLILSDNYKSVLFVKNKYSLLPEKIWRDESCGPEYNLRTNPGNFFILNIYLLLFCLFAIYY